MMRCCLLTVLITCVLAPAAVAADRPNNPVGVHLMIHDARTAENIEKHTAWARRMCGPWGYVKIFEYHITPATQRPDASQVALINKLYERQLIPVVRLGGQYTGRWKRPADTPDGTFEDIAQAFKRVVAGYPLSDECPLYIEVWNEANLGLEWGGTPKPAEFARMYVATAKAIRSLNEPRIRIAPGAMSPGGEYNSLKFIEACCKAEPEFVNSFDYWATHPYPGATPPDKNAHDGKKASRFASIDLWVHELKVLADNGCDTSKLGVIGTETSYRLGHGGDGENPLIDKDRRADYHLRAVRDHWMKWPDVLGMCIWEWAEPFKKMTNSTWVHADSTTDDTGWPSMPTLDYEYIAALAKPTSNYACISGQFIDARTKAGIPDIVVTLNETDLKFVTDRFGNYILSPVDPETHATYTVRFTSQSHGKGKFTCKVAKGQNVVVNKTLNATKHAHLRGYTINTATGRPLPGAEVTIEPGHFRIQATAIGLFELTDIPHGYYDVIVEKRGFYSHRQQNLFLAADRITEHYYRLGPGKEAKDNLIRNGGFEGADAGEDAALAWDGAGLSVDSENAYAGDRAQRLTAIKGDTASLIQWTNYTTIGAGKRYRLQCLARTQGVIADEGKGLALTGTVVTNPHKTLAELRSKQVLSGDRPWTLLTLEFTAPPEAGRVSLEVKLDAEKGTAWIDEAAVIKLPNN